MTDYCLFTIEHPKARRIFIRGIMDITPPIGEYENIIRFGEDMSKEIPSNPFKKGEKDYNLYEELVSSIKKYFEDICDELIFARTHECAGEFDNYLETENYCLDYEKVKIRIKEV